MLDRAAILREAHAETRRRCAPSRYQRSGDRYDPTYGLWRPTASYRVIFAAKLRESWHVHKMAAAEAAWEAAHPVPVDVQAQADALRADALAERITGTGNAAMVAKLAAASAMLEAARLGAAS